MDSKAASRYIDDAQLRAKEMILKQHKIYYNVLHRDIRRPEYILNKDPLDNNFNRMGLLEKRQQRLQSEAGPLSAEGSPRASGDLIQTNMSEPVGRGL